MPAVTSLAPRVSTVVAAAGGSLRTSDEWRGLAAAIPALVISLELHNKIAQRCRTMLEPLRLVMNILVRASCTRSELLEPFVATSAGT